GTGKELVARAIHNRSGFAEGPFVAVNCAALPSELVESELFGHTRGAFTGAGANRRGRFVEADGGSIFLDEISEMPLAAQAKILRVIETREVTPVGSNKSVAVKQNIIAASNRDLRRLVEEQRFREDLLYRLNVIEVKLPALRERKDEIDLLCEHFLGRFAEETGTETKQMARSAIRYLYGYSFPGNVRELRNLMERVNIYCDGQTVEVDEIKPLLPFFEPEPTESLRQAVAAFEYRYLKAAIAKANGNISQAARELGIERSHLYKKIKKLENDTD
ncbi:MAG: sigma-54-dependent Fis family transcriptional regulator, partial [candidate division Zixibacteria bacterium]|nr:sigma-54-dependent Fis family transcriptional regulator [candidate division Zixibacteria bacterium]